MCCIFVYQTLKITLLLLQSDATRFERYGGGKSKKVKWLKLSGRLSGRSCEETCIKENKYCHDVLLYHMNSCSYIAKFNLKCSECSAKNVYGPGIIPDKKKCKVSVKVKSTLKEKILLFTNAITQTRLGLVVHLSRKS